MGTVPRRGHSNQSGSEGKACNLGPMSQVLSVFVMFACTVLFYVCKNSHGKPDHFFVSDTSTELRGLCDQLSSESLRHQILYRLNYLNCQKTSFAFAVVPGAELF